MTATIAIFFTLVAAVSCGNMAMLIIALRKYWKNSSIKSSWAVVSVMTIMITALSVYSAYYAWSQL